MSIESLKIGFVIFFVSGLVMLAYSLVWNIRQSVKEGDVFWVDSGLKAIPFFPKAWYNRIIEQTLRNKICRESQVLAAEKSWGRRQL